MPDAIARRTLRRCKLSSFVAEVCSAAELSEMLVEI
jgi:hypothetical protein